MRFKALLALAAQFFALKILGLRFSMPRAYFSR